MLLQRLSSAKACYIVTAVVAHLQQVIAKDVCCLVKELLGCWELCHKILQMHRQEYMVSNRACCNPPPPPVPVAVPPEAVCCYAHAMVNRLGSD